MRSSQAPSRLKQGLRSSHPLLETPRSSQSLHRMDARVGRRSGGSGSGSATSSEREDNGAEEEDEEDDEDQRAAQEQAEENEASFMASQREAGRAGRHASAATSTDDDDDDEAAAEAEEEEEEPSDADDEDEPLVPEHEQHTPPRSSTRNAQSAPKQQEQRTARVDRRAAGKPAPKAAAVAAAASSDSDEEMKDAPPADEEDKQLRRPKPKAAVVAASQAAGGHAAASHSVAAAASPARAARAAAAESKDDAMADGEQAAAAVAEAEGDAAADGEEDGAAASGTSDSDVPLTEIAAKKRRKKERRREKKRQRQEAAAELDFEEEERPIPVSPAQSAANSPRSPAMRERDLAAAAAEELDIDVPMSQEQEEDAGADGEGGAAPTVSLREQLLSGDIREQELGVAHFKTLFRNDPDALAVSQTQHRSSGQARREADKLDHRRLGAASALMDAVHRGNLQDRLASDAVHLLLSRVHLLSVRTCATLVLRKLNKDQALWFRVSAGSDEAVTPTLGSQCRPTINFELLPKLIQRVTEQQEITIDYLADVKKPGDFFALVVQWLVSRPWRTDLIDGLLSMVQDLNLSKLQHIQIITHVVEDLPHVPLCDFGSVCFRLWLHAPPSEHEDVMRAVLQRMEELEHEVDAAVHAASKRAAPHFSLTQPEVAPEQKEAENNRLQLQQLTVMLLLQWEVALKNDANLGDTLLHLLQQRTVKLSVFAVGLVLDLVCQSLQPAKPALDLLVGAFASWHGRRQSHDLPGDTWLAQMRRRGEDEEAEGVNPMPLLQKLMAALRAAAIHPMLLQAISRLGFTLMDRPPSGAAAGHEAPSQRIAIDLTGSEEQESTRTVQECCIVSGATLLFLLFCQQADTQKSIVKELLSRVDRGAAGAGGAGGAGAAGQAAIKLLRKLVESKVTARHMEKFTQEVMASLEWLHCQTPAQGMQLLTALLPLLRSKKELRDFAIRTVHKLLFLPHSDARMLAIDAFFLFIESPYDPSAGRLHRAASAAMPSSSQHAGRMEPTGGNIDLEFFHESALSMFRRALSQPQAEVRARVYKGLLRLFHQHVELRPSILELLQMHLSHYQHDASRDSLHSIHGVRAPIRLDMALDASRSRVVEPLPFLYSVLHSMLNHPEMGEVPQPEPGAHEFSTAQLQDLDPDERSAALLQLHMRTLLEKIKHARSLKDLGIIEGHLAAATMDDPAGVASVLQAQLMHGVLCSFFEYVLLREMQAPASSSSASQSQQQQRTLSVHGCHDLVQLFELIHQLQTLLTTRPKVEKKPSSSTGGSKKKKKKDDDDEEDEEDEEEDDDGDDDEDDADEEDSDEEPGPRSRPLKKVGKKRGKKGKAKAKKKDGPKAPPKAVVALSRGGRWQQYALTWQSVCHLLRLSQAGTGRRLHESGAHRTVDPLAPQYEHVGDQFYHHAEMQRWICTHFMRLVDSWQHSEDPGEIARRLEYVGPLLLDRVTNGLQLLRSEPVNDEKKAVRRPDSLLLLHMRLFLLVFQVLVRTSPTTPAAAMTMFLYEVLPLSSHDKVVETDEQGQQGISYSKLFNWFCGKLEVWCKELCEQSHWSDAASCLEVLLYLLKFVHYCSPKHLRLIHTKRRSWSESLCSMEIKDAACATLLLDYTCAAQGPEGSEISVLMQVAANVRKHNTQEDYAPESVEHMDIVGEANAARIASWCVHKLRVALDDVDSALSDIRAQHKSNADGSESREKVLRKAACQRMIDILGVVDMLLRSECDGKPGNDMIALVQRLYKTLTRLARVVLLLLPPPAEYVRLSQFVHDTLQPSVLAQLEHMAMAVQEQVRKADTKSKKDNILKADAQRTAKLRKCQEIWTVCQLSVAKKSKPSSSSRSTTLFRLVADTNRMQQLGGLQEISFGSRMGSASMKIKNEPVSPIKRSPAQAAAAANKRRAQQFQSPQRSSSGFRESQLPVGNGSQRRGGNEDDHGEADAEDEIEDDGVKAEEKDDDDIQDADE